MFGLTETSTRRRAVVLGGPIAVSAGVIRARESLPISPVIVKDSLARIDASELGRRLASRPSRGGHPLACALLERLGEGGHGLLKALCPALPLTQVQKGAVAGVVVLITAAVGYTWSGIFGLIAGVVLEPCSSACCAGCSPC